MKIKINDLVNTIKIEDSSYSLSETKAAFLALSPDKAFFLEITDVYEELIRFTWLADNKWLIDHPVETNILHQQRYADTQACLQCIEKIYQEYDIEAFEGFVDVPVGEFTLDEVLAFQVTEEETIRENDDATEDDLSSNHEMAYSSDAEEIDWFDFD